MSRAPDESNLWFDDLVGFRDFWGFVTCKAPEFPRRPWQAPDEHLDLDYAVALLKWGLQFVRPRLDEARRAAVETRIDEARAAFESGDKEGGFRILHPLGKELKLY